MIRPRWLRTAAPAALLAGMLLAGFQPFYLRVLVGDATPARARYAELAYRKTPGLRELMSGIRERVGRGESIALWAPFESWGGGYWYVYMRSSYLLAGRNVLPLLDRESRPLPANLAEARWLACWGGTPEVSGFERVWSHPAGALYRRIR